MARRSEWWQHRQVRDVLTAVDEHHRQVDCDPTSIGPTMPLAYRGGGPDPAVKPVTSAMSAEVV
jgi:hypothetical protein